MLVGGTECGGKGHNPRSVIKYSLETQLHITITIQELLFCLTPPAGKCLSSVKYRPLTLGIRMFLYFYKLKVGEWWFMQFFIEITVYNNIN